MKALLSDERAEDLKDDLQVAPNFPDLRLKPRLPPRTVGSSEVVSKDLVVCKDANHRGVMVALRIPHSAALRIAIPGGEPPEDLHCTIAYLGDADELDPDRREDLVRRLKAVAATTPPLSGTLTGYGRFRDEEREQDVIWVGLDSPDLSALRHRVVQACEDAAVPLAGEHGFSPHVTLSYVDEGAGEDSMPAPTEVEFKWLTFVVAGTESQMRLAGDEREHDVEPQEPYAYSWSMLMRPEGDDFISLPELEHWAQGRGDLLVRAVPDAQACVVVKKGRDVHVAIQAWDAPAYLDDLVVALRRVPHDYVLEGWLAARALDGEWLPREELAGVLCADVVANPVLMPRDLLALDGDLTGRSAADRLELLRGLVAPAGSHVIVPLQVACGAEDDLEAAVDACLAWRPSEGHGLAILGVEAVQAGSTYVHGPSAAVARLCARQAASKAWSDEARQAALEARRAHNQLKPEETAQALARLAGLPSDSESEYARAYGKDSVHVEHLGMVDDGWKPEGTHPYATSDPEKHSRVMRVPLDGIGAAQDAVSREGLAAYARRMPDPKKEDYPAVARTADGKYHLLSGHTRAGAAALGGRSHLMARVYQFNDAGRWVREKPVAKDGYADSMGAGPGPTDVPEEERLARLRQGSQAEPGFIEPEKAMKDASPGVFGTPGVFGILSPEQGVFRKPRFPRNVDKEFGDNASVGVPLTLVPSRPRGSRKPEDETSNPGGPLFPHFVGGPETGVHKEQWSGAGNYPSSGDSFSVGPGVVGGHRFVVGRLKDGVYVADPAHPRVNPYEAIFLRRGVKLAAWDESDHPRVESGEHGGEFTSGGGAGFGRGIERRIGFITPEGKDEVSRPMKTRGGLETWEDHTDLARRLLGTESTNEVVEMLNSGAVRYWKKDGEVNVDFDGKNQKAAQNAITFISRNWEKDDRIYLDVRQPDGKGLKTPFFDRPSTAIVAIREFAGLPAVKAAAPEGDDRFRAEEVTANPDSRKPRKWPDAPEEAGFNDSYLSKADAPLYLTAADMDEAKAAFVAAFRAGRVEKVWSDAAREAALEARRAHMKPQEVPLPRSPALVPPPSVYHVTTTEAARHILTEGLRATGIAGSDNADLRAPHVYFTTNPDDVKFYVKIRGAEKKNYAVVEFAAPIDGEKDAGDQRAFHTSAFRVGHDVPPSSILAVHVYEKGKLTQTLHSGAVQQAAAPVAYTVVMLETPGPNPYVVRETAAFEGIVEKDGPPDEARDESGRWTGEGGMSGAHLDPDETPRAELTKKRVALRKLYATDKNARDALDVAAFYTQGEFEDVREIAQHAADGTVAERVAAEQEKQAAHRAEGDAHDADLRAKWAAEHPGEPEPEYMRVGNYGERIRAQDRGLSSMGTIKALNGDEIDVMSNRDAVNGVAHLQDMIVQAPPTSKPLYRGMKWENTYETKPGSRADYTDTPEGRAAAERDIRPDGTYPGRPDYMKPIPGWRRIPDYKVGQRVSFVAPSSFTRSAEVADDFADGVAGDRENPPNKQRNARGWHEPPGRLVIELEPGARALNMDAVSPWRSQKEAITQGEFEVTRVEDTDLTYGGRRVDNPEDTVQRRTRHVWIKQVAVYAGRPYRVPDHPKLHEETMRKPREKK